VGEDASSIASHIKLMQEEMAKNVPNMGMIDDRMMRTLFDRRSDVNKLPLVDVLVKYPALRCDLQVRT
jgi:hypothetical protein